MSFLFLILNDKNIIGFVNQLFSWKKYRQNTIIKNEIYSSLILLLLLLYIQNVWDILFYLEIKKISKSLESLPVWRTLLNVK